MSLNALNEPRPGRVGTNRRAARPGTAFQVARLALVVSLLLVSQTGLAFDIEVSVSRAELLLGTGQRTTVTIVARGEEHEQTENVALTASVGTVTFPRRAGPGRWTAQYRPPEGNYPRVALIIARARNGGETSFAGVTVRLRGRTVIPLRSDVGAMVTVRIGDEQFGPVRAGRGGMARVPVEVPPGAAEAEAQSTDRLGNRRRRLIPLGTPSFPRILIAAPERVQVGRPARFAVLAVDAAGVPTQRVSVSPSRGRLKTLSTGPRALTYELATPPRIRDGIVALTAALSDPSAEAVTTEARITLEPREPARLLLRLDRDSLVPGSGQQATVRATVLDRFGNPRLGDTVQIRAGGQPVEATAAPEGGVVATVRAPPSQAGLGRLPVEAQSGDLVEVASLDLVGGRATLARIEAPETVVADGSSHGSVRILLIGPTGLPSTERPNMRVSLGRLHNMRRERDGWWSVQYVPPRTRFGGADQATIEAARDPASARVSIRLVPPEPWLCLGLFGGLSANLGSLVGPVGRVEISTRIPLSRGFLGLAAHSGVAYSQTSNDVSRGRSSVRLWQVPFLGGFGYGLRLAGRLGAFFGARGGGLLVAAFERNGFQPDAGRLTMTAFLGAAANIAVRLFFGEVVASVGYDYAPAPEGSHLSGNLIGMTLLVGYRLYVI